MQHLRKSLANCVTETETRRAKVSYFSSDQAFEDMIACTAAIDKSIQERVWLKGDFDKRMIGNVNESGVPFTGGICG